MHSEKMRAKDGAHIEEMHSEKMRAKDGAHIEEMHSKKKNAVGTLLTDGARLDIATKDVDLAVNALKDAEPCSGEGAAIQHVESHSSKIDMKFSATKKTDTEDIENFGNMLNSLVDGAKLGDVQV